MSNFAQSSKVLSNFAQNDLKVFLLPMFCYTVSKIDQTFIENLITKFDVHVWLVTPEIDSKLFIVIVTIHSESIDS